VVYVNYGLPEDYDKLKEIGVDVAGKIAMARYGNSFRGVKAFVAEEHKCAALIIYSDPADDGYVQGDPMPKGPWRPMSGIQRGSVLYIFKYPGDPLTPGVPAEDSNASPKPQDAANLPRIPTLPISPRDAAELLSRLDGPRVPKGWQGGLPFSYHTGPGRAAAHLAIKMEYKQRALYDVIGKLRGEADDEWVVAGNHHDAWVFGAVDPSSGTTSLLEASRALGALVKQGWKPRRTIVFGFWDGEEYGLLGSTEWVEGHRAELQRKAVAYVNLDAVVSGTNFGGGATPSLAEVVRDATREVKDPDTGKSVFEAWKEQQAKAKESSRTAVTPEIAPVTQPDGGPTLGPLGSGSDYTPFFQHAGIPSVDMGFGGDYGVYHSIYDDFFWMKHFGDPKFGYHAAMGRIAGLITLRLAEADVLPFDYASYATAIEGAVKELEDAAKTKGAALDFSAVKTAVAGMKGAAEKTKAAQEGARGGDRARLSRLNRALVETEQALLAPDGLTGRPWFRHTIYAPGTYTGYAAVVLPGVREAMDKKDWETAKREMRAIEAALGRAKAKLEQAAVQ
jgi:N-acetylated-alpha-linked acidic dipeptidase